MKTFLVATIVALCLASLFSSPAFAGEDLDSAIEAVSADSSAPAVSFLGKIWLRDKYLVSTGFVLQEEPVVQALVSADFGRGWSASVWFSSTVVEKKPHEIDLDVVKVSDLGKGFELTASIVWWIQNDLRLVGDDAVEPALQLSWSPTLDTGWLKLFVREEFTCAFGAEDGRESIFGLAAGVQVVGDVELSGSVSIHHDSGAFGADPGLLLGTGLELSVPLGRGVALGLEAKMVSPLSGASDRDGAQHAVSASLSISF